MGSAAIWIWLGQLGLLTAGGLLYFFAPGFCLAAQTGLARTALSPLAVDQLRMSSPYLLGFAGFALFGLMTWRTVLRPRCAAVFALVFGTWAVVQWIGVGAGHYAAPGIAAAVLATLLAAANLSIARQPPLERIAPEDGGVCDTRPALAFVFWTLQGFVLSGGSLAFLLAPAPVLSLISGSPIGSPPMTALAVEQTRLLGALATGMAGLSFVAMRMLRNFAWRGFAYFFSCFLAVWVVSIAWILLWGHYALPVLAVLVPGLVFLPMNVWLHCAQGEWDPEGASRTPDAWSVMDLVPGPPMGLSVLRTRRRSSHLVGVGARGHFRAAPGDGVPPHDLFTHAPPRPVQVRFANLTELDDASLDVRGCAIKFSDHHHDSPFDLLLNTGSFCPAYNLWTFTAFVASKFVPAWGSELIVRRNLIAREGAVAGLRRAPDSYTRLFYYGQIVRDWVSSDGRHYLVRYRCVPAEPGPESGLPDEADIERMWIRDRRPGDDRPPDYLRRELHERLARGPVQMRLQAQFHEPQPGDSDEWYNASVDWDEDLHPWCDLGTLELTEALSDADTEVLQFDPGNHPPTLGIPCATGPSDYRSMGDSEARVVRTLQRLRAWMYGVFGLPPLGSGARR